MSGKPEIFGGEATFSLRLENGDHQRRRNGGVEERGKGNFGALLKILPCYSLAYSQVPPTEFLHDLQVV